MTKAYVFCMALPAKSNEALKIVRKIRNIYVLYTEQGVLGIIRKIRK